MKLAANNQRPSVCHNTVAGSAYVTLVNRNARNVTLLFFFRRVFPKQRNGLDQNSQKSSRDALDEPGKVRILYVSSLCKSIVHCGSSPPRTATISTWSSSESNAVTARSGAAVSK
jgi:hypothetical protein